MGEEAPRTIEELMASERVGDSELMVTRGFVVVVVVVVVLLF